MNQTAASEPDVRIAIVTTGRFHVLDLARELSALGYQVSFYSVLPLARAMSFGLPVECHRPLLPYLFPLVAAARWVPPFLRGFLDRLLLRAVDSLVSILLGPCDIFIGMSGLCARSARVAREKHGALVFIERSSRHILSQKEIVASIAHRRGDVPSRFTIRREVWAYAFADMISVPSEHARESFVDREVPLEKVFVDPFGVDLKMFRPTKAPPLFHPTVIFVGIWCLRKGCDVLWQACEEAGAWHLLHVGRVGDLALPRSPFFTHVDPVPQGGLPSWYEKAHVSVLCSREDGFGLVLAQALACGLPVVCTNRTGGADLRALMSDKKWVTVIPPDDHQAAGKAVEDALTLAQAQSSPRDILGPDRPNFSWSVYAERYSSHIQTCLERRR